MTPANKDESMGEVEEEMGLSRDLSHTASDGQGNPTLADIPAEHVGGWTQTGAIFGPDGVFTRAEMVPSADGSDAVITFGDEERPQVFPMLRSDLLHWAAHPYHVRKPEAGWRDYRSFSEAERRRLRPVAETLAMLDGNAFFGGEAEEGHEWYEMYLPEAHALYEANGGDTGWAGEAFLGDGTGRDPSPPVIDGASSRDEPPSPPTGRALLKDTPNG